MKRELGILYCFSVDIPDKIQHVCYTQNFHLTHKEKVMPGLLFYLIFFFFSQIIVLLFRNMKEKLSRPQFPLAKNILNPSKESIYLDTISYRCHFIFFIEHILVKGLLTFLWKMASWEYGGFPLHSSLSLEISLSSVYRVNHPHHTS